MNIPSNVSAIPEQPLVPHTTLPAEILLLREPEVVTLLTKMLTTQEAMLFLLQSVIAGRRTIATSTH